MININAYLDQPLPCPGCGSKEDYDIEVTDTLNGMTCEYDMVCVDCGCIINSWAYGAAYGPETRRELWAMKWYYFKVGVKRVIIEHWGYPSWSSGLGSKCWEPNGTN